MHQATRFSRAKRPSSATAASIVDDTCERRGARMTDAARATTKGTNRKEDQHRKGKILAVKGGSAMESIVRKSALALDCWTVSPSGVPPPARHRSKWRAAERRRNFKRFGPRPTPARQLENWQGGVIFRGNHAVFGLDAALWRAGSAWRRVMASVRPGVRESMTRGTAVLCGDGGPGKSRATSHAVRVYGFYESAPREVVFPGGSGQALRT
jgi:hypothetical protein